MNATWTRIASRDGGEYEAYLSLPPAGRGPGLLLFQEIFGVNRHIRAVADQYALDGFVVLAPDVFWRQAPRVELGYDGAELERARTIAAAADAALIAADLDTSVAALRARPEVVAKVGTIGYCMGGRLAFLAAAQTRLEAAVCYYGGGIQDRLDLAASITCPLQLHYAGQDPHIPATAVERVRAALKGRDVDIHLYDAAGHGFNCWERAAYHAPSACLAHGRALLHLGRHLF
jgi:carboxymethylenebutenolidase